MYIIFNITGLKFDNVSNYQKGEQNYTCGEKNKWIPFNHTTQWNLCRKYKTQHQQSSVGKKQSSDTENETEVRRESLAL